MMFYELQFLIPFFLFFLVYRKLNTQKQNILIVVSSFYFYGLWDWRFLGLLILQTVSDYFCALIIAESKEKSIKKLVMYFSIAFNLGMLATFKYANFFIDSFLTLFPYFGTPHSQKIIHFILPPAISFYTFESMSYVIDVYRGTAQAEKRFFSFAAFISFFPKLVAGPIERAHTLLAQINKKRVCTLDAFLSGVRLFMWGLFKKLVVAENMGALSEPMFSDPSKYDSLTLLFAAYCFTLQIYGDFSGYTDMARGLSRMMGIELSLNFNFPYFAKSLGDFWRRWHITLGTWLRDYIYIPLGGSKKGEFRHLTNLLITFFASGLWHGADWTFVLWGVFHGVFVAIEAFFNKRETLSKFIEMVPSWVKVILTFHIVVLLWILFRSENIGIAVLYYKGLFGFLGFENTKYFIYNIIHSKSFPDVFSFLITLFSPQAWRLCVLFIVYGSLMMIVNSLQYAKANKEFDLAISVFYQSILYSLIIAQLIMLGSQSAAQFIYFQF